MRFLRGVLILAGIGLLSVGALGLPSRLDGTQLRGLATWALGAVVLHDGVLVPVVCAVGALLWLATRRLPGAVRAVVMTGAATAGLLSLLAWPLILRQGAVPNDTVLPQHYGLNLLWLLLVVLASTAIGATAVWLAAGRRRGDSRDREEHDGPA